jgi:hypothetical protein
VSLDFNWDNVHLPTCELSNLDDEFMEMEVYDAIKDLPSPYSPTSKLVVLPLYFFFNLTLFIIIFSHKFSMHEHAW